MVAHVMFPTPVEVLGRGGDAKAPLVNRGRGGNAWAVVIDSTPLSSQLHRTIILSSAADWAFPSLHTVLAPPSPMVMPAARRNIPQTLLTLVDAYTLQPQQTAGQRTSSGTCQPTSGFPPPPYEDEDLDDIPRREGTGSSDSSSSSADSSCSACSGDVACE